MIMKNRDFLFGENLEFVAGLYKKFLENKGSVTPEWATLFEDVGDTFWDFSEEAKGPSWKKPTQKSTPSSPKLKQNTTTGPVDEQALRDSLGAILLIRLYRVRGHLSARLDPLNLMEREPVSDLDPAAFGFKEGDWDRPIFLGGALGYDRATLREIMEKLQATYCGSMGVEFMHMVDPEQKDWIQRNLENQSPLKKMEPANQEMLFESLMRAESFEQFLNTKHKGAKRFGLEGCEGVIPALEEAIKISSAHGVEDVVLGMAHRGRLNVLANIMEKPLAQIFYEFSKHHQYCETVEGSGDVKYHLGYSSKKSFDGREVTLSLTPNPSHLEAVDPVVLGRVRARQDFKQDANRSRVMGVLLHGDAAFPGQGVVSECFGLSDLEGYKTGGTFHIVINNQIGFTTSPHSSRSSWYSSDFAKSIGAPIFHVNGDDPEAIIITARLAAEFRHTFQKDVVIDIIGYRRFGHNESDDPSFTQPLMYKAISNHPSVKSLYEKKLLDKGILSSNTLDQMTTERKTLLERAYLEGQDHDPLKPDWMRDRWASYKVGPAHGVKSALSIGSLKGLLSRLIMDPPEGFKLHGRMKRLLDAKKTMHQTGVGLDWGTAESLAFASILEGGHAIRLSGQDSGRGTFSQRHALWTSQDSEKIHVPLNHLAETQAKIEILNSPLSEFSVLGYEYGYALSSPETLVLWEAQFGDFANGAQVVIDQFISSGESKWHRLSALVMLLPHGYEGQGPEHSSARLERYLQLCAQDNMHVAYCSTPASYFHILRRQILGPFRKPLILMTPKSLLRHPLACSTLKDLASGTQFEPVIPEHELDAKKVTRVVLCSGKVYYDLLQERQNSGLKNVALVRLEELYPFPEEEVVRELKHYKNAEVFWCQEEPENMGAWHFIDRRLEKALSLAGAHCARPTYVGRTASASPATGFGRVHEREQKTFVKKALGLEE